MGNRVCPNCSQSHYSKGTSISASPRYRPVYKNGKIINPNINSCKTPHYCQNCNAKYNVETNKNREDFGTHVKL